MCWRQVSYPGSSGEGTNMPLQAGEAMDAGPLSQLLLRHNAPDRGGVCLLAGKSTGTRVP